MSFNTFCRECAIHFSNEFHKSEHVEAFHYGVPPANPAVPEHVFYAINANVPAVRAKTCPVCFVYFENLANCITHVNHTHPASRLRSLFAPTKEAIISEWKHLVEAVYPGAFQALFIPVHFFNDVSDSSDDEYLEIHDAPEERFDQCYPLPPPPPPPTVVYPTVKTGKQMIRKDKRPAISKTATFREPHPLVHFSICTTCRDGAVLEKSTLTIDLCKTCKTRILK